MSSNDVRLGGGIGLFMCAGGGDPSFLRRQTFSTLKLVCHPYTCVEFTDVWPPFPIIIRNWIYCYFPEDYDFNAAIVHPSRVCEMDLCMTDTELR